MAAAAQQALLLSAAVHSHGAVLLLVHGCKVSTFYVVDSPVYCHFIADAVFESCGDTESGTFDLLFAPRLVSDIFPAHCGH